MKTKSKWPKFLQRFAKWLVRLTVNEDVDVLLSNSVSTQLKLNTLWATGTRVIREYRQPNDESPEWNDFQDALWTVKHSSPRPAGHTIPDQPLVQSAPSPQMSRQTSAPL
jgi:hypothetical protein